MTIAEGEATQLALATPPVSREAAQRVLDYLVFHRSLLGEAETAPVLLDRYMTLVQSLKEGVHIVIPDPFQKATALLFELVMEEAFDPWEIDLARFTQLYVERLKAEDAVNFAVAGRLVYMAWSILLLQSQELLRNREPAPESAAADATAFDDGFVGELTTPESLDVTSAVLAGTETPALNQMVRHPETRPVSLLELVHAFGEAEVDARRALRIQELRDRLREQQRAPPEVLVHGDIPERDLADTWEIALRHPKGEPFEFLGLWRKSEGRDRLVAIFLAVLFLAREQVIHVEQTHVGESPLTVIRIGDERPPPVRE